MEPWTFYFALGVAVGAGGWECLRQYIKNELGGN